VESLIPLAILVTVGAAAYWAVVLSEGVYLGPRAVTWLYDRVASRYDRIKNSDPVDDEYCLARPLLLALDGLEKARVLDVGTGTGRMPALLQAEPGFAGSVVGLDRSRRMLAQARARLGGHGGVPALALGDAGHLPFAEASFDAVTCVEVLEFTAHPEDTLREMARVLKPGGVLLVSNRVGVDALWYPGRHCGRGHLEALLDQLGLEHVETQRWQVYYDLVWARRSEFHP
jgi:ubiquinone/menaquinone biosynthesis C-methylase UbiE